VHVTEGDRPGTGTGGSGTGGTGAGRPTARFAATSAAGLVVVVVLGLVAALFTQPLLAADEALAVAVNGVVAPRPWLVGLLSAVTALGSTVAGAVVLATLAAALLARRRHRLAAFTVVAGLGAQALVPAVKALVGRLRPTVEVPVASASGPSFPSGHTVTVTVWVGVLLLVLLPVVPERLRRPAVVAGAVLVVVVGLTRLGLGVHFLSDVVVGWVVGLAWLAVTTAAFRAWRGTGTPARGAELDEGLEPESAAALAPVPEHDPPAHRRTVAAQLAVVAVLLVGVLIGLGQLVVRLLPGTPLGEADVDVVRDAAAGRVPVLDAVSLPAGEFGSTGVIIGGAAVAAVLAVAVLRRLRAALLIVLAVAGETLMFMAAASITGRERPPVQPLDAQLPPTSSFPSGHTAAAVALYGAIALIVVASTRAWWRWLVLATAVALVVLVAASRLYRGAHHPSDVLASLVLTLPWLYALDRLVLRPGSRTGRSAARSPVRLTPPVPRPTGA
jgi:undecaprenyl-diphosphatase